MNKPSATLSASGAEDDGDLSEATETLSLLGSRHPNPDIEDLAFYPGELVADRFSIVGSIGRGGMGEVYEAVDQDLGQRVAVKTLRPGSASSDARRERFRQEILLARQVTHPNVCRIFDLCYHTSRGPSQRRLPLLSMELLTGETLSSYLRRQGSLESTEVHDLAVHIARGLAAAHEAGVVHCDLKSSNVMLVPQQDASYSLATQRAVVMDFGLASTSSAHATSPDSRSGGSGSRAGGTPGYMAPEVLQGEAATPASDIYSLGVVLFEMLVGERPGKLMDSGEFPLTPRPIEPFWRLVIARCLDHDPAQRFPSAGALLEKLDDKGDSSRRFLLSLATGAALMLLLSLAVFLGLLRPEEATRARPALAIQRLWDLGEPLGPSTERRAANQENWVATVLPELLGSKLASSGQMRLVPRDTLQQMGLDGDVRTDDVKVTEALTARALTEIRGATGADYVLSGGYLFHSGDLEVTLVLQETRSGKIALPLRVVGPAGDLTPLISGLAREIHDHLRLPPIDVDAAGVTRLPATSAAQLYAEGLEELDTFRLQAAISKLESALATDDSFLLARIALIRAYLELGELVRASTEIQIALSSQDGLPRDVYLTLEALAAESVQDWDTADSTWDALWTFFPDEIEYGLGVVRAFLESSRGAEALAAVERLRAIGPHLDADPRIDLAEARAAGQVGELERQLAAARRAEKKALRFQSHLLRARARLQASSALRLTRGADDALKEAREARALFEKSNHRPGVAEALLAESICLRDQGQRERAVERVIEARRLYEALEHRRGVADALRKQGDSLYSVRPLEARALYEQALRTYEAMGNQAMIAATVHNLGLTYMNEQLYKQAFDHYRRALTLFRQVADPVGESLALNSLGFYYYHAERDIDAATDALGQSLEIKRRINDRSTSITTLVNLSNIYLRTGPLAKAEAHLTEALELTKELERFSRHAMILRGLAQVRLYQGRLGEAEGAVRGALEVRRATDSTDYREQWVLARIYLEQDRFEEALPLALGLLESTSSLARERGRLLRAEILTRQNHLREAFAVFEQLDIELDDEDWTDLLIRGRRLQVRHLALGGHPTEALALNRSIEEMAGRYAFKMLELEIRIAGCGLEAEKEVARLCRDRVRKALEPLGFDLLLQRLNEVSSSDIP